VTPKKCVAEEISDVRLPVEQKIAGALFKKVNQNLKTI
jgi:hypothetical protein